MIVDNLRVRVDWDKDGYINERVGVQTPPNLFPKAPYVDATYLSPESRDYTNPERPEIIEQVSFEPGNGAAEIIVPDNAPFSGSNNPIYYQLGFKGYEPGQTRLGDIANVMQGGHQANYPYRLSTHTFYTTPSLIPNWSIIKNPAGRAYGDYVWSIPGTLRKDPATPGTPEQMFGIGYTCTDSSLGLPFILSSHYAYYDVGNQFSQSNNFNGTIRNYSWNGPPVSEGQYKLYIPIFPADLNSGTQYKAEVIVYGNNGTAGSPSYGRVFIRKWSQTVTYDTLMRWSNSWLLLENTINVPAGVTQIAIEIRLSITSGVGVGASPFCIGNIRLLPGTTTSTRDGSFSRGWDSGYPLRGDQFAMKLDANKAYRFEFDLRFQAPATRHAQLQLIEVREDTKVQTVLDTRTYSGTNVAVRPAYEITSVNYARYIYVEIVWYETLTSVYATDVAFQIRSPFLKEGITAATYSGGALAAYEDITDRVLAINTSSGKTDFEVSLAEDGQASIEVDNQDGFFSPANTASPIYSGLSEGARVWIDYNNGTDWLPLWSGWLEQIDVKPGRNKRAVLIARQGVEQLRGNTIRINKANLRVDEVIAELVVNSLWTPSRTGGTRYNRRVARDTRIYSTEDVFAQLDRGEYEIPSTLIAGATSKGGDDLLGAALQSENMHLFVGRDGKISVLSRNQWNAPDLTAPTIDLDTDSISAEYATTVDVVNQVTVSIGGEQQQLPKEIIWSLRTPVKLNGRQVWTMEMTAQKTEGQRLALEPLDPSDLDLKVYRSQPSIDRKTPSVEGADTPLVKNVVVSIIENDGRVYFKFENKNSVPVWVDASLSGRPVETEDNSSFTYTDTASVSRSGVRATSVSNKFIRTSSQAAHFAWSYMRRKALIGGEFISITVLKNINMDWTLGTQIIVKETATKERTGLRHVIIGEDFSTDTGALTVTYRLARLFQPAAGSYATYTRHYTGNSPFGHPTVNFVLPEERAVHPPDELLDQRYGADGVETAVLWRRRIGDGVFYFNALNDQFTILDGQFISRARLGDAANYITAKVDLRTLGLNRHQLRPSQSSLVYMSPTTILGGALMAGSALNNDSRFDASIPSGSRSWGVIPVVPKEFYEYRLSWMYGESAPTQFIGVSALAQGALWGPGMTAWSKVCSGWTSHLFEAAPTANTVRNVETQTLKFQAQETTSGAADSVPPVRAVGFVLSTPNPSGMPFGLVIAERVVRMTRRDARKQIRTTDGLTVFATAFLRGLNSRPLNYTLTVYSGKTGFVVGSAEVSVDSGALAKVSVAIPANHTHLWATLTPNTNSFGDVPQDVMIVAYGFTNFNPATPAEMSAPSGLVNAIY